MNLRQKRQAWLRASLDTSTLAGLILIAVCWFTAAFVSSVEREQTIQGLLKQSDSVVRLFEQNVVQLFERFDRTLLLLRKSYEDDPQHFDLSTWAARAQLVGADTLQLAMIGPDGFQTASTAGTPSPLSYLGDREHFRKQINPDSDRLVISEPVIGRATAKVSIKLTRRLRAQDGSFGGVIALSVDPNFIKSFYQTVDLGKHGSMIVRNLDGAIIAQQGLAEMAIGRQPRPQPLLDALARSPVGYFWGGGSVDGNNRLVAYRTSDRFPLIFSVGLAERDALSVYAEHRTTYFGAAASITLLILLATLFTIRRQLRLNKGQSRLELLNAEIARQNLWFDAALANMSNGLSMFDADGNLLVWNARYIEIYGMSSELIQRGVNISVIVEHRKLAQHLDLDVDAYVGQFRQDLIDHGRSVSQTLFPDGRTISVVNTAIAGGGWVAIHDDITERIRDETSIFQQATELAHINMRFDAALSNMTQGLCLFDADRKLVIANRRFQEMYDFPDELVKPGTPLPLILQHHATRGVTSELSVEQHARDIPALFDQNLSTADGRVIAIKRTPTADGGWVATHEDVTAQKRAEQLIAEKARQIERINLQFDAALSNMSQGISMYDGEGRLQVWNERFAEIYRLSPDLLRVGTHVNAIMTGLVVRGF